MLVWVSIAAVVLLAVLSWSLYRRFGADQLATFTERRRAGASVLSRGEYVDGNRHMGVALALTPSTLFYENRDMQASLDLEWVREVEYDTELATGGAIAAGEVLRLRSSSQTFEFVLPVESLPSWHQMLPARRAEGRAV